MTCPSRVLVASFLRQVGHGAEVGARVITSWLDPDAHPVHALSISTDMGATGVWELYRIKGGGCQGNALMG